jgi:hypothetical protein
MKPKMIMFALLALAPALSGATCPLSFLGAPGAQDGAWTATTIPAGVLGSSTFAMRITLDRMLQLTVNGADWTVQQAFPVDRSNNRIKWGVWAVPPAGVPGPIPATPFIAYTFDVATQPDGTLSGTVSEAGGGVITVLGSPFNISMKRF